MTQTNSGVKKYQTIGVCGLDCGLCSRYYTQGPSRCPGCGGPDFFNKHPSCSFITCCVKKKHHEVCAECAEFPCNKFKSAEEYQQLEGSASYPPYKKVMPNLHYIRANGIEKFILQQKKRIRLLETFIADFNDGRSRSYYCRATALLDIKFLENALEFAYQKVRIEKIKKDDIRTKAKILKTILSRGTSGES